VAAIIGRRGNEQVEERRPVIAASVPGMGMDLSYEKK
jgi:hypothetical protein